MKSAATIEIDYRPSSWLLAAIIGIAVLAIMAIALSGMPAWAKATASVFCAICTSHALYRHWHPRVRRAVWQAVGEWQVVDSEGRETSATLHRGVARGAWVVLGLRNSERKRLNLILGPDNCAADTRRRLRVRLGNWKRSSS
jgi:hypothetical protein